MYRVAICEDNPAAMEYLRRMLEDCYGSEFIIETYVEAVDLLDDWSKARERKHDIVFMDIRFQDEDGIQVARKLEGMFADTCIIFITGYIEYAERIFEAEPIYFLIKPVSEEKIRLAVGKALKRLEQRESETITLTVNGKIRLLDPRNVLYVESHLRESQIYESGQMWKVNMKLNELEEKLPQQFVRIHQSFLINLDYVKQFSASSVILHNGLELSISRARYKAARERFMEYLHQQI